MAALPITSNNPPSSANGMPGVAPLRNDSSTATDSASTASQASSAANDQAAELFSAMLARQIGDTASGAPDAAQIRTAVDAKGETRNADQAAKDAQGQAANAASNPVDPAGALAAVLAQIPLRPTDVTLKGVPPSGASQLRADAAALSVPSSFPLTGTKGPKAGVAENVRQGSSTLTGADSTPGAAGNLQPADSSGLNSPSSPLTQAMSDAAKNADMKSTFASQTQGSQNAPKALSVAVPSAAMPNLPTGNVRQDIAQTVTTPVGNNGWAHDFSQKIVWMSTQQTQTAELHLNPPDLGPLNVVMKISDNQLTAQFTSPHSSVRDAVENALPRLREILADNNITLGNATVSDQAPRDRNGDGFMNQGSGSPAIRDISYNVAGPDESSSTTSQTISVRRHNGMLDTFA